MILDMYNHVDYVFDSGVEVNLVTKQPGGYTGVGGVWEDGEYETEQVIQNVNIQPLKPKEAEFFMSNGGTINPTDSRVLHINDGTMLWPDDNGQFSQLLEFSDGLETRVWRVRAADNRPARNFCRAVVERYRANS